MKTKLCRPVLIDSKETKIGLKIFKEFDGSLSYSGKTSEIPEELAKKYVRLLTPGHIISLWQNYKYSIPQQVCFTKCSAKESIQSACPEEYCIIYEIK